MDIFLDLRYKDNEYTDDEKYCVFYETEPTAQHIGIYTEHGETLKDALKDRENFLKVIDDEIELAKQTEVEGNSFNTLFIQSLNALKEIIPNLEDSIKTIRIDWEVDDIISFLKNSPECKNKEIILRRDRFTKEELERIHQELGNEFSLSFQVFQDVNTYNYEEVYNATKILDRWEEQIRLFDYSPLEIALCAYDIVRDRIYLKEPTGEDTSISREIVPVLNGNYVVCAGYVRLYEELLSRFDIPVRFYSIARKDDPTIGHAIAQIYLKDDKYGIDGVFYCDPTANRKFGNDNFLYTYSSFLRTREDFFENMNDYDDITIPISMKNLKIQMEKVLEGKANFSSQTIKQLNKLYSFPTDEQFISSFDYAFAFINKSWVQAEKIQDKGQKLFDFYDGKISAETLAEAVYEVRKNQYYINPERYPFGCAELLRILKNSRVDFEHESTQIRLLNAIFGRNVEPTFEDNAKHFLGSSDIPRKIEGVRVAKVLQKVLDKKTK